MFYRDVAEGVHRIGEHYVNWYLVEEAGRITVIDAGLPASWDSLLNALREIGRSPSEIAALVLTHAHFDHIGFAERARVELGVPVWVHENDASLSKRPWLYMSERSPLLYLGPKTLPIMSSFVRAGAPRVRRIREIHRFANDDILDVPGSPSVVFTPGHTLGHCALHLPERDCLITGDALVTLDPYTAKRGPRLVSRAATADSERAIGSLVALSRTGARNVLPGHGEVWAEGIERAVEEAWRTGIS